MADDVDLATRQSEEHLARLISYARAPVPVGAPGECDGCFEESPRLVGGLCAPCRDGRNRRRG